MKRKLNKGVYLVIDPSIDEEILLQKLELILKEAIVAVQLWDNFSIHKNYESLVEKVIDLCHKKDVPVIINNRWEYLLNTSIDGVHFDNIPENIREIKSKINRPFIAGITCNNDLSIIHWGNEHELDYISFCSIFPSLTDNSCELVTFESIKKAREITDMPIFLAGGIKPENLHQLSELSFDGIAVVSGIMSSSTPDKAVSEYMNQLKS